jgi:hypothetical protein
LAQLGLYFQKIIQHYYLDLPRQPPQRAVVGDPGRGPGNQASCHVQSVGWAQTVGSSQLRCLASNLPVDVDQVRMWKMEQERFVSGSYAGLINGVRPDSQLHQRYH